MDVDTENSTYREEYTNKKTRIYVYNVHLFYTPSLVPVRHMTLDLDNVIPGVVIQNGKTNNDDTIRFLSQVYTCAFMNTGKLLLHKYIMTKHPSLVAKFIQYICLTGTSDGV